MAFDLSSLFVSYKSQLLLFEEPAPNIDFQIVESTHT